MGWIRWAMVLAVAALALGASAPQAGEKQELGELSAMVGLEKRQIASFDPALCGRLIRFGKAAYDRARYHEAKRFFYKAILVDPTSRLAWAYYDMAVVTSLARKVEENPGLVGAPLEPPGGAKGVAPAGPGFLPQEEEEGC